MQHRANVRAIGEAADIIFVGAESGAVEFQDVTAGIFIEKFIGQRHVFELADTAGLQSNPCKHMLRVSAIVFQAVAIGAAADHVKAVAAQSILQFAARFCDILEQDDAVIASRPDPVEFIFPVRGVRDESCHGALGERLGNGHPDVVAFGNEPLIQCAEVAGVPDPQEAHLLSTQFFPIALETLRAAFEPHQCAFGDGGRNSRIGFDQRANRFCIPRQRMFYIKDGMQREVMPVARLDAQPLQASRCGRGTSRRRHLDHAERADRTDRCSAGWPPAPPSCWRAPAIPSP